MRSSLSKQAPDGVSAVSEAQKSVRSLNITSPAWTGLENQEAAET